jgi:hypothetical protein
MPTKTGAQIDAVLLSLQAIERIGYRMPDLSYLKILPPSQKERRFRFPRNNYW